jgi:hypothetical protein
MVEITMTIRYDWARIITGDSMIASPENADAAFEQVAGRTGLSGESIQFGSRPTNK